MSVRAQLNQSVAAVGGPWKLFGEGVCEHVMSWAVQHSDVTILYSLLERMNPVVYVL